MNREQQAGQIYDTIKPNTLLPDDGIRRLAQAVLDAILPQITTAEELEALPDRAFLARDDRLFRWRKRLGLLSDALDGLDYEAASELLDGPLTVVWQPS